MYLVSEADMDAVRSLHKEPQYDATFFLLRDLNCEAII